VHADGATVDTTVEAAADDRQGRHLADGQPGEVRVPVDGHAGGGRHEAETTDGYVDGDAAPARGRPSAGN
jgi:hypothetical protein